MSKGTQPEINVEIKSAMRVSLEIRPKSDLYGMKKVLMLSSIVEELLEDGLMLIHMPMHQGYHYPLPRDEVILMQFFVDSNLYALPVQFEERVEQGGFMFAKVRQLGEIELHQRRDCYRVPCSLPVTIERHWRSETIRYHECQCVEARMINFSDGGMMLATDENIERGEKITLIFDIGKAEVVEGVALRKNKIEEGKYLFRVAVRFREADKNQKQRFYKYIVSKQMEERRRWTSSNRPLYQSGKERGDHEPA